MAACDSLPEMFGVPVDDDGGEQIEACHSEVLPFGGPVADFALAADAEGALPPAPSHYSALPVRSDRRAA